MPKYTVVFVSYGYVDVDADNKDDAIDIAHKELTWNHFETSDYVRIEENENA